MQTNCGVTGLRFRNFMVVPATGAYEGTEADGSKVTPPCSASVYFVATPQRHTATNACARDSSTESHSQPHASSCSCICLLHASVWCVALCCVNIANTIGLQVLTNEGGDRASLVDRRGLFDLSSFYIANPNADSGLTVKINPKVHSLANHVASDASESVEFMIPHRTPTSTLLGFNNSVRRLGCPHLQCATA